jgi:hypothetical protein
MSKLFFDARAEGAEIRPFKGTDALAVSLEKSFVLRVISSQGSEDVTNKATLEMGATEIKNLGISIECADLAEVKKAVDPLVMSLDDVSVYVLVSDRSQGVLRDSILAKVLSYHEMEKSISLAEPGVPATFRPFENSKTGFKVELALVHNKEIRSESSISPRVKGALLGLLTFEVRPVAIGDSLQPQRLTDEVRANNNLGRDVWSFFKAKSSFMTASTFDEALGYYVSEEILQALTYGDETNKKIFESLLFTQAVTQLVYEFSNGLQELTQSEQGFGSLAESQVLRFFRTAFSDKNSEELIAYLSDEPERAVAAILSKPKQVKKMNLILKTMSGGINDVSDSKG